MRAPAAGIDAGRAVGYFPAPLARGTAFGEWLSLVEHLVRDQGVAGSNAVSPTNTRPRFDSGFRIGRGLLFSRLPRFGPQMDQTANRCSRSSRSARPPQGARGGPDGAKGTDSYCDLIGA